MRAREFVTEQAAAGPIRAYHGTFQPSIQNFAPLSHFGTLAAAEERLRFKGKKEGRNQPGRIYKVILDIKRPFRVRDFAGIHSPTHFAFDLRQAGLIDQEEMLAITRLAGEAGQAQALIRKLRDLGFDGMIYRNKYEDPGSESYVITDPSQVISVRPADVSESRMVEYRRGVMDILRDELPDWPDYVIKDWIGGRIKNQEDLDNTLGWVRELSQRVQPNSWRQVQKMPLTFDMLYPKTRYMMKTKRQFGDSNPFMIPRDRERLEQALELVKTKGMENLPPVIMLQHPDGLELVEGWHRTMAAFRLYPKGFRVNAWIGQDSGIKENSADGGMTEALVHRGQVRNQDPDDVWHVRDDRTRKLRHHRGRVVLSQARPKMYQDDARASYQYTPDPQGRVRRSLPSFHWAYIQGNMVNRLPQALQQGRQLWFKRGQGFVYADTQEPFAQADYVVFDNDGRVMAYDSDQPAPAAGPAVVVSPSTVAEGLYDDNPATYDLPRRALNVPELIKRGAIFITYPHGEQGWETDNPEDWAFSLITLYNVMGGGWPSEAKKYLKPASYKRAEQQINSSAPNLGSDKLVYDGKYNQILWSIKKLGIPGKVAFITA